MRSLAVGSGYADVVPIIAVMLWISSSTLSCARGEMLNPIKKSARVIISIFLDLIRLIIIIPVAAAK